MVIVPVTKRRMWVMLVYSRTDCATGPQGAANAAGFVYYVPRIDEVFLLLIYSKTEVNDISAHEIRVTLEKILASKDE